jgi:hypothetical protein
MDLIHIEGFSGDCFAWRQRTFSLIITADAHVQRRVEGSALDVLGEVLNWEPCPMTIKVRASLRTDTVILRCIWPSECRWCVPRSSPAIRLASDGSWRHFVESLSVSCLSRYARGE